VHSLDAAGDAFDHALAISPQNDHASLHRGMVDLLQGRPEKALARVAGLGTEWCRLTGVALAQHDLGREREARQALDELVAKRGEDAAYQIAEVYSRRGEKDRAFQWLERARVQRDTGLIYIRTDRLMLDLRGDPRYAALLEKMKMPPD